MQQPDAEEVSAPHGLRPFGLVTQQPSPATPAGSAGLAVGDALLSFGDARHLRDIQRVLAASIGRPVTVICVDNSGRCWRKYVVPHVWDPKAPKSLLGCQVRVHNATQCICATPLLLHALLTTECAARGSLRR